jgi:hypothetical protein
MQYLLGIIYKRVVASIDNGDFDLLKITIAVREMSEGELP